jgi:hypothetical protein
VLIDRVEQVLFHGRHPDTDPRRHSARQTLRLVPMVVGHQHIRDELDAHLVEVIEDLTAAEIDEHPRGPVANHVHVAGVPEQ